MGKGDGSGHGSGEGAGDGAGAYKNKDERIAVPAMPYPMAILCCILNFLIPGFGTMMAGFSAFCCSRNEDMNGATRFISCLTSCGIGFLQLLTAVFCMVGWCWSCAWGIFFIGMSSDNYYNNKVEDHDGRPGMIVYNQPATHVIVTSGNGPSTTVINQPNSPGFSNQPPGPAFGPSMNQHSAMASQAAQQQYPGAAGPSQGFPAPPPYEANDEKKYPPGNAAYPPEPPPAYM